MLITRIFYNYCDITPNKALIDIVMYVASIYTLQYLSYLHTICYVSMYMYVVQAAGT